MHNLLYLLFILLLSNRVRWKPEHKNEIRLTAQFRPETWKWIMKYWNKKSNEKQPELTAKNVLGIITVADTLMIKDLIQLCLDYISKNLEIIIKASNQIIQIKPHLAKLIAKEIDIDVLDELSDEKHFLISRLYKKKLEIYFDDPQHRLKKCKICNNLFTENGLIQTQWTDNDHRYITGYGKVASKHFG